MNAKQGLSNTWPLLTLLFVSTPGVMAAPLPNFAPFQPAGWSDKIVVSRTTGTTTDSINLTTSDFLYLDWAITNKGPGDLTNRFATALYVDGTFRSIWFNDPPFSAGGW